MSQFPSSRRILAPLLALTLIFSLAVPASAFFWNKKDENAILENFSKNGLVGEIIAFTNEDFATRADAGDALASITVTALPDVASGMLTMAGQPVSVGTVIETSALSGLRFQSLPTPAAEKTSFTFIPTMTSGTQGGEVTVTLHLLSQANQSPIARNMDLSTYKNVSITGYFDAVDSEGDVLTFQLTTTPARGNVTMAEDGSSQFVYTPYENKTGKDTFTFVAMDSAGNTSPQAQVTVQITKPDTKVTYADMDGNDAHKASIRLAEEGIYVGAYVDGRYFFEPDQTISRAEFLTMAMAITDLEPLENVSLTGFSDDLTIPTWAKGNISAALMAGAIQGSSDESGAHVFQADEQITRGEATVMLNNLLNISNVPAMQFAPESADSHWAGQAAANLAASGVMRTISTAPSALAERLTREDVALMLDGALDVMSARDSGGWFFS